MRKVLLFLCISFFYIQAKATDSPILQDSAIYQFGNDTLLQTLTVRWSGDSVFNFSWLSQDLLDRGMIEMKGRAKKADGSTDPVIKSCTDGEFPANHFIFKTGDCHYDFFIQYLHKEKVWIDRQCVRKDLFKHAPLESVGILNKVGE